MKAKFQKFNVPYFASSKTPTIRKHESKKPFVPDKDPETKFLSQREMANIIENEFSLGDFFILNNQVYMYQTVKIEDLEYRVNAKNTNGWKCALHIFNFFHHAIHVTLDFQI